MCPFAEIQATAKEEERLREAFNVEPEAENGLEGTLEESKNEYTSTPSHKEDDNGESSAPKDSGSSVLGKRPAEAELEEGELEEEAHVETVASGLKFSLNHDLEGKEDDHMRQVTEAELRKLAASTQIKALLRSSELQKVIREVETASDRSAALDSAAEVFPELQSFVGEVLTVVGPRPAGAR